MTWTRRSRRFLLLTGAAAIPLLTSGCAILKFAGSGGIVGTPTHSVRICASGAGSYKCPEKGNLGLDATTGFRQLLVGAQIPAGVGTPDTLTSTAPQSMTFTSSPGYAAELQRLQPAPAGRRWVGWISPSLNYNDSDPSGPAQNVYLQAAWQLPHAPDGSPYAAATITSNWVVGIRNVTSTATAARPVACGNSLTTAVQDSPDPNPTNVGFTYCMDSQLDVTSEASDYGIVTSGARATGTPGSLVSMPFILRSGNVPTTTTPAATRVTSTLPGATLAVTPEAVPQPPLNGDSIATVAVGIPAGAAPGVYDVTFTATVAGTLLRTGVGKLTVLAPPGSGTTGGGRATKRKLTTILPKGLPVGTALRSGVPVLVGSNVAGPALVRLQQGPTRRPTVSVGKRVRLKAPGPVKVTFRSTKLVKGPYRVTISVAGKVVRTVNGRLAR